MKKNALVLSIALTIFAFKINAQKSNKSYGIQAGPNFARYTPRFPEPETKNVRNTGIIGFYLGGFINFEISKKLRIRPSLIFALQGSKLKFENIDFINIDNSMSTSSFSVKVVESTILVPVAVQNYLHEKFYIEAGPQIGYTINTRGTFDDGTPSETIINNDKLDFGFIAGLGYDLNENFTLNSRYFFGITERRDFKTSALNIGIEYNF